MRLMPLLVVTFSVLAAPAWLTTAATSPLCTQGEPVPGGGFTTEQCISDSELVLSGESSSGGSVGRDESSRSSDDDRADPGSGTEPAEEVDCNAPLTIGCRGNYTVEILAFPDVTVNDLASFRPIPPALTGDPAGFGVAELPANIYASAVTEEQTGDLLGFPIAVRFTPVSYDFSYGDGTSVRTATGGASWTSLGQAQFTTTPTTHTYRERGTYAVTVTVNYAPAVNFGTGWKPVPGTIAATGPGYSIRILEARTALVRYTCDERPTAPGC